MLQLIKNLNLIWNKFKKINNQFWDEIEEQLILNDVSVQTANFIISEIKQTALAENINEFDSVKNLIKQKIKDILSSDSPNYPNYKVISNYIDDDYFKQIPRVWMIVGVNGVGKTSTVAKLANYFKNLNKNILFAAADTFRSAAFEQIDHFAKTLNLPIVHHQRYSDPGAVVYDSLEKAIAKKIDIILIDTAGRMHTAYNLMEELKKIKKVIIKKN